MAKLPQIKAILILIHECFSVIETSLVSFQAQTSIYTVDLGYSNHLFNGHLNDKMANQISFPSFYLKIQSVLDCSRRRL